MGSGGIDVPSRQHFHSVQQIKPDDQTHCELYDRFAEADESRAEAAKGL